MEKEASNPLRGVDTPHRINYIHIVAPLMKENKMQNDVNYVMKLAQNIMGKELDVGMGANERTVNRLTKEYGIEAEQAKIAAEAAFNFYVEAYTK